ncbi:MAG: DUF4328 domain-containing protein [Nocardioidaceae bacterium]
MTQQIPAGWYPDPQSPTRSRWYDGTQWTQHTSDRSAARGSAGRPPLGQGWFLLGRSLQFFFVGVILLNALTMWWAQRMTTFAHDIEDHPARVTMTRATELDRLGSVVSLSGIAAVLVVGVLFITWLFLAHRSDAMNPAELHHASGWAIGGWFVPFLNLVRPYQMVQEVQRASRPGGTNHPLVLAWWLTFLTTYFAERIASASLPTDATADADVAAAMANAVTVEWYAQILGIVAAVLAILVVRRVAGAVRRSSQPSPAQVTTQ